MTCSYLASISHKNELNSQAVFSNTAMSIKIIDSTRLTTKCEEKAVPLSLLDSTTANFSDASAIWLYEKPTRQDINLVHHLRGSLAITLESYPQLCGHLKAIESTDGTVPPEATHFPPHARRFRRLYAHYGTGNDPGVEFVHARSSGALKDLYPEDRVSRHPAWICDSAVFKQFMPSVPTPRLLSHAIKDENGRLYPLLAIQITELACGGFVLALKETHPLADTTAVMSLLKDWASVSQSMLLGKPIVLSKAVFDPALIDNHAAGDINAEQSDQKLIQQAMSLPMHRYDWWAPGPKPSWAPPVPEVFDTPDLEPAGLAMPWEEWDVTTPVSNCVIHLSREQVISLWEKANEASSERLSQHDAIIAHIWSCISRARGLGDDSHPIHCNLVYGVRSSFGLDEKFLGSPAVMMNVEHPASKVCNPSNSTELATRVRNTLKTISEPTNMAAHLYSIAFEKSPQRIWQAFLGQRHILVTTWARANVYGVDFGFGSTCSYVESVLPDMDGNIVVKEAPGPATRYWTDNGVDISVHIRTEHMERLMDDPLLFPTTMPV